MSKRLFLFLIAILIAISYLFSFEKTLYQELLKINSKMQKLYLEAFVSVNEGFNKYFNQLEYIEQLKEQNRLNIQYKLLYQKQQNDYNELIKNIDKKISVDNNFTEVKLLSYYQLYDYSKVILDKKPSNSESINALITYDGFSAGIVLNKNDQSIGYLNQNKKCNYTVFIGDENAPGITSGTDNSGRLVIKYVPIWKNVEIGDEVITSSMDSIFPHGIKVGKVKEIHKEDNIQEVYVEAYANTLGTREYYLYEKLKRENRDTNTEQE